MANKKITSTNAMNRDFLEDRCTLNKVLRIIGNEGNEGLLMPSKSLTRPASSNNLR